MLQLVHATARAPMPVGFKAAASVVARDEWLALSHETSLGFGTATFLREALTASDLQRRYAILVVLGNDCRPASLHFSRLNDAIAKLSELNSALTVVCVADEAFLAKLDMVAQTHEAPHNYYLPPELKTLAQAGLFCRLSGRAGAVYRAAKGMELLCEAISLHADGLLIPLNAQADLSMQDSTRVLAARNLIAERFSENLTLEEIARACGINRSKLTRAFRAMFNCSISEAILGHKLSHASELITISERSISSVGYAVGYANNASFARAFHRHFGVTPSEFRVNARRRAGGISEVKVAA